eukprot:gb/GECH01006614.1/.p1 GENE.gb/GECH01006614.1/~~gb/GECH01006614.1/.p1  ORF type:complete len:999 (+),score=187.89 gb/GECH01006614.1/:1-2997(+)
MIRTSYRRHNISTLTKSRFLAKTYNSYRYSTSTKHDYAKTLNLPKTEFTMRANALEREPQLHSLLIDHAYKWQKENRKSAEEYILHDGPPYANGSLHMGHFLNKVLKDFVNRFHLLQGKRLNFIPGWDCHGLPIELKAVHENREKKLDPREIRKRARQFAESAAKEQLDDCRRWGLIGDWENHYKTMDKGYEAQQMRVFLEMFHHGMIYRGRRPVYWSPSSKTALAEAELEYPDTHSSISIYVTFPIVKGSGSLLDSFENPSIVIWTTTPWTLPSNMAISYHQDIEYSIVKLSKSEEEVQHLIIADSLVDATLEKILFKDQPDKESRDTEYEIIVNKIKGSDLFRVPNEKYGEYLRCRHPLTGIMDRDVPLLEGDHVTTDIGTGLVHTAPGHGMEDFLIGKEHGIDIFCPVNDDGMFTEEAGEQFRGLSVLDEGNIEVIRQLSSRGCLLRKEKYRHKYPYDWRTKKPVILRTTDQWFADLSALKSNAMKALEEVHIVPSSGRQRLEGMLGGRSEWCISRQRSWGVPIPVFYHSRTGEHLLNEDTVEFVAKLFEQHGSDCWWSMSEEELLPPQYKHLAEYYDKGTDTLDVWFDSGSSWAGVLRAREMPFPADVYLEGSDQHRGWFQSSLLTSVANGFPAPFKNLVTHGFVLDESGRKMSKSLGNIVSPQEVINGGKNKKKQPPYGADILRLWVSSTDYTRDVLIGKSLLATQFELGRKIRNTARFMLGNLSDFSLELHGVPYEELSALDQYALHRIRTFNESVNKYYNAFQFKRVHTAVTTMASAFLSSFYLEIVKDRLYANATDSKRRRAAQTVIYNALRSMMIAIAPIMCHLAEDIYQHFPNFEDSKERSVFCLEWPQSPKEWKRNDLEADFELINSLRGNVYKALEKIRLDRIIGSSLEARVTVYLKDAPHLVTTLERVFGNDLIPELEDIFVVSNLKLENEKTAVGGDYIMEVDVDKENILIGVEKETENYKCPRCWRFASYEMDQLCKRCDDVV